MIPPYEVFLVLPGHVLSTPAGHPTTSVAFFASEFYDAQQLGWLSSGCIFCSAIRGH